VHALHRIVRSYESKRCSELQVALNGYWSLITLAGFAMATSMSLYEEGAGPAAIWAGSAVLVCWLAFRLALRAWLRVIVRSAAPSLRPLLLLRSSKAHPHPRPSWIVSSRTGLRRARLEIGGPDLAGAQMEPTSSLPSCGAGWTGSSCVH